MGVDGIISKHLKLVKDYYIVIPLVHICNFILTTGVFPAMLKTGGLKLLLPIIDLVHCYRTFQN